MGADVGYVLEKATGKLHRTGRIKFVLVRNPSMPTGYHILTAFPELVP